MTKRARLGNTARTPLMDKKTVKNSRDFVQHYLPFTKPVMVKEGVSVVTEIPSPSLVVLDFSQVEQRAMAHAITSGQIEHYLEEDLTKRLWPLRYAALPKTFLGQAQQHGLNASYGKGDTVSEKPKKSNKRNSRDWLVPIDRLEALYDNASAYIEEGQSSDYMRLEAGELHALLRELIDKRQRSTFYQLKHSGRIPRNAKYNPRIKL